MSELIAAKAKGELLERFRKEEERTPDDMTTSELVRDLLDRGLTDRTTPLFARLGLPNRVAARLEADREDGEPDEEVIRRFLREAVDARDEDALDKIEVGADDDLRTGVESVRDDGEALDDAVRRLLREGVAASRGDALDAIGADDELRGEVEGVREEGEALDDAVRRLVRDGVDAQNSTKDRLAIAAVTFLIGLFPVLVTLQIGVVYGIFYAAVFSSFVIFNPLIDSASARLRELLGKVVGRIT